MRQPLYLLLCGLVLLSQQHTYCSANRALQLSEQQQAGSQEQQRHLWLALHQKQDARLRRPTGRRRLSAKQWALRELDGAVEQGYFYTNITVGDPPQRQELLVDTGSDLTFMACAGCVRCGDHGGTAQWNPQQSDTAQNISCQHTACSCDGSCGCKRGAQDDKCYYSIAYGKCCVLQQSSLAMKDAIFSCQRAEGSKTQGYMVQDLFHLSSNASIPVLFGCDQYETGAMYDQEVEGLIGMSNTPASLHAQLAAQGNVADVFSLCYGWPEGGGMMLGDGPIPSTVQLTQTPVLGPDSAKYYPGAYSVDLQGIALGGKNISLSTVQTTIFDSGTTLTYVPPKVHQAFLAALTSQLKGSGVRRTLGVSEQDFCWENGPPDPADLATVFPSGSLSFAGGGTIDLRPERYLVLLAGSGSGIYCLGIYANQPNDGGPSVIIGTVSVRNVMVKYNVERQFIGLGNAECASLMGQPSLTTIGAPPAPLGLPAGSTSNLTGSIGGSTSSPSNTSMGTSSPSNTSTGTSSPARPLGLPVTPRGPPTSGAYGYNGSGGSGSSSFVPQIMPSAAASANMPVAMLLVAAVAAATSALLSCGCC